MNRANRTILLRQTGFIDRILADTGFSDSTAPPNIVPLDLP